MNLYQAKLLFNKLQSCIYYHQITISLLCHHHKIKVQYIQYILQTNRMKKYIRNFFNAIRNEIIETTYWKLYFGGKTVLTHYQELLIYHIMSYHVISSHNMSYHIISLTRKMENTRLYQHPSRRIDQTASDQHSTTRSQNLKTLSIDYACLCRCALKI